MNIKEAKSNIVEVARDRFGEGEYKYYAIPVSWRKRGRRPGQHFTPITGLDKFEVSKDEWVKEYEESKANCTDAFMGRLKRSYTKYRCECVKDGWREKLAEWGESLTNDIHHQTTEPAERGEG